MYGVYFCLQVHSGSRPTLNQTNTHLSVGRKPDPPPARAAQPYRTPLGGDAYNPPRGAINVDDETGAERGAVDNPYALMPAERLK